MTEKKNSLICHHHKKGKLPSAHVNRTTFYRHYETTRDLLEEIVEDLNKKIAECNTKVEKGNNTFLDDMTSLFVYASQHPKYASLLTKEEVIKMVLENHRLLLCRTSRNPRCTAD